MDILEKAKQKLKEQEESKRIQEEKIIPEIEIIYEEEPPKPISISKEFEIKTDYFRTGISLITGSSKRERPPILQQKLIEFLENHKLIQKGKDWFWVKKEIKNLNL